VFWSCQPAYGSANVGPLDRLVEHFLRAPGAVVGRGHKISPAAALQIKSSCKTNGPV